MKCKPVPVKLPSVSYGSAAVRIGGPAITHLIEQAALNGMTVRQVAETIILQHQASPGAQVITATGNGGDPVQAAVTAVVAAVKRKRQRAGNGAPVAKAKPRKGVRK